MMQDRLPGATRLTVPLMLLAAMTGCQNDAPTPVTEAPQPERGVMPVFVESASELGVDFRHQSGEAGEFYFPAIMGSGVALLDADSDGDLDVLALQGGPLPGQNDADEPQPDGHRLYLNQVIPTGTLGFVDAGEQSGLSDSRYGMGVATGDIDNDGDMDVYISHFGENALYVNDGSGRFEEVTEESGTGDDRFGSSVAFFDYDLDGRLDLFVSNYNAFTVSNHRRCRSAGGRHDYCDPLAYAPAPDRHLRSAGRPRS